MPNRFELLVFDWDGTLMDSAGAIVASIQASCRDLGLQVPERERASHVIGLGLKDALAYAVPELPPSDYGRLAERYRHHYLAHDSDLELFPGMREMLAGLKQQGYLLAVATGKSRAGLERVLEATQLKQYFDSSRCADETHSKPHPAMLQELMRELLIEPEATLMIGDTAHDLQMAVNAGVPALAVSYGAHPRDSLTALNPLGCVDTPQELLPWLIKNA
ncbi:MAG: HAD-IIIA family hydrolase [Betaproteobacteria bacterium]|nr:MAG: HAD-IIIA family hydrolase [Betaproteobacteria bacterium]